MRLLLFVLFFSTCITLLAQNQYFTDPEGNVVEPLYDSTLSETWSEWKVDEYSDFSGYQHFMDSTRWRNQLLNNKLATVSESRYWCKYDDTASFSITILDHTNQKLLKQQAGLIYNYLIPSQKAKQDSIFNRAFEQLEGWWYVTSDNQSQTNFMFLNASRQSINTILFEETDSLNVETGEYNRWDDTYFFWHLSIRFDTLYISQSNRFSANNNPTFIRTNNKLTIYDGKRKTILKYVEPTWTDLKTKYQPEEIKKLIINALEWSDTNKSFILLPLLLNDSKSHYIGIDFEYLERNIQFLKNTGYFTTGFMQHYKEIILDMHAQISNRELQPWAIGDIPPFKFPNNGNPWCNCQDNLPWSDIEIQIDSQKEKLIKGYWYWNTDNPYFKNHQYKFELKAIDGRIKIEHLEGFSLNNTDDN